MSNNRAWMPLHIDTYLADTGYLTAAEHGAYMLLIMTYWRDGGLPEDERMISRIARMSKDEWAESRDVLASFFKDGWRHSRIDEELAKADEIIEKRRNAALGRHASNKAHARALHVQSNSTDTGVPPSTTNPSSSSFHSEDETPLTPAGGDDELFDEAWRTFPHHPESVKSAARKQFDRLSDADKRLIPAYAKHYRAYWVEECVRRKQTQDARLQYVPHLATWIKSEAWREALSLPVKAAASSAVLDALEYVDRITQEELFARCERLRGKAAPTSIQRFGFPREIVAAARSGEGAAA